MTWQIITADVLEGLAQLPDESVQTVITSPPYWGLRDYGTASWEGGDAACDHLEKVGGTDASTLHTYDNGLTPETAAAQTRRSFVPFKDRCSKCGAVRVDQQLGLEPTPEAYVERMVGVFREVRRVLRRDGTCWLNIGDSYAGSAAGRTQDGFNARCFDRPDWQPGKQAEAAETKPDRAVPPGLKPKDLVGVPWRLAFALQADGWYLRSDIIWSKPNPMPESVTDRPTKAHEYVFLLTRSARYFYDADAVREPHTESMLNRVEYGLKHRHPDGIGVGIPPVDTDRMGERFANPAGRNMRSVWSIPTEPFPEAHFATFPKALVVPCVKAGTSEKGCCPECGAAWVRVTILNAVAKPRPSGRPWLANPPGKNPNGGLSRDAVNQPRTTGWKPQCDCYPVDAMLKRQVAPDPIPCTVLDPFAGSGTVGVVALRHGRSFVGIELNPEYAEMARNRIRWDQPLFNYDSEVTDLELKP